jgi:23S rRNA (guanine745-N1)-methyltransferase
MLGRMIRERLRCPVCGDALTDAVPGALRCGAGHAFDLARQGYANLLTGRAPAGADTAEMVAARADLLAAGHLDVITTAVVEKAAELAGEREGLVVDVGAGTGHHLAAVLDALPDHHGVALDVAKAAARRAARAHPRAAAVVCDVWRGLPLADGCADLVLDIFAPRNGGEFHRVLRPDGALLVVTPHHDHLAELVGPLGLLQVDPAKADRLDRSLGGHFVLSGLRTYTQTLALSRADAARLVLMGPNAWHADPAELAERLATWSEPVAATVSVDLGTYRPLR